MAPPGEAPRPAGTNEATLEISSLPPLSLESRLGELIRYPHGCLEQTTSALFPQFFLPGLMQLSSAQKAEIDKNVKAGLERMRAFQGAEGGFQYWPGGGGAGVQLWVTSYVGHFLIEAERRGYPLPPEMRSRWTQFQRTRAQSWAPGKSESVVEQAYRLYTLAVAGEPELGAMNRLREERPEGLAQWLLSGAYHAAGVRDAADVLSQSAGLSPLAPAAGDPASGSTFASPLRDKGLVLQMLALRRDVSRGKELAEDISGSLSSEQWHHTQALAHALLGLTQFYGAQEVAGFDYEVSLGTVPPQRASSREPVVRRPLPGLGDSGGELVFRNLSDRRLFAMLVSRGVPPAGSEEGSSAGLALAVDYANGRGETLDPAELAQGAEVTARLSVRNLTGRRLENLALTVMSPSGWEIRNPRWEGSASTGTRLDYQDVRDDRVHSYYGLAPGEERPVLLRFTAAYRGRFYLPAASVEAMYEATLNASAGGRWVVVRGGP